VTQFVTDAPSLPRQQRGRGAGAADRSYHNRPDRETITGGRLVAWVAVNVPIYEDCDSKFGIGLEAVEVMAFNPEQAKDF